MSPVRTSILLLAVAASGLALPAQLAGTLTINAAWPASATNFSRFADATAALATQGVVGPVRFLVYDDGGPFVESIAFTGLAIGNQRASIVLAPWGGVSPANPVVFEAASGEFPRIDCRGNAVGVWWNGADDVTLRGLEFFGADQDAICIFVPGSDDAQRNRLERLYLHDCGGVGILLHAITGTIDDTLIENCLLERLLTNSIRGTYQGTTRDGYISARRDDRTIVRHNTLIMDRSSGLLATYGIGQHGDASASSGITRLEGNLVLKSAGTYVLSFGATSPLPLTSEGNLWFDLAGGPLARESGSAVNDLADWQARTGLDASSLAVDPRIAWVGGGWRPQANSPVIDLAPTGGIVTRDFDGNPRDAFPDAGAFEDSCLAMADFQMNSAAATLLIDGQAGSSCLAASATKARGVPTRLTFGSTTGMGWEAVVKPAALVPLRAGGQISPGGQILNLDVFQPGGFFVNGGLLPDYSQPLGAPFRYRTWTTPSVPGDYSLQAQHLDPAAADGWTLSQAAELRVL